MSSSREFAKHQKQRRQNMRIGIIDRFDMLIDGNGNDFGLARNIAAKHKHHAELADRVSEGQDGTRQEPRFGQRYDY